MNLNPLAVVGLINNRFKIWSSELQDLFFFSVKTVAGFFRRPFYISETIEQMYAIGVGSLYLIILTGIFAGQGFALAFSLELADFGAKNYLGRIMSISIIRELAPVLTGLMIAARVSAGITAEIGSMKASNQLDAMVAFGIDPIKKLAVPRLISLVIMAPVLTIVCDIIAIVGGWIIAVFIAHVSSNMYWASVWERLVFGNIFVGLIKPVFFGFAIAFIACYKGFTAEGGTKGVGTATTNSVVMSSITVLLMNFILTKFLGNLMRGYM